MYLEYWANDEPIRGVCFERDSQIVSAAYSLCDRAETVELTNLRSPASEVIYKAEVADAEKATWSICRDEKTGSIITNDKLRVMLNAEGVHGGSIKAAYMKDVYAIGDCAQMEGTSYPATAQVANQKGEWLAKKLNKGNEAARFKYKNLGVMAYLGNRERHSLDLRA